VTRVSYTLFFEIKFSKKFSCLNILVFESSECFKNRSEKSSTVKSTFNLVKPLLYLLPVKKKENSIMSSKDIEYFQDINKKQYTELSMTKSV
jgi:hypothetical protein